MILSETEKLYLDYISKVENAERQMKPADGLFGIGKKVSDDPCHEEFADKLGNMLSDYAKTVPDSDEVSKVLGYIYGMPLKYEEADSVYWMFNAVHGLALQLIEYLSPEAASGLLGEYKTGYPKSKRLPVQKQTVKLLEKRAKKKT